MIQPAHCSMQSDVVTLGKYGDVYYAILEGKTPVAVKKLKNSDKTIEFDREIDVL